MKIFVFAFFTFASAFCLSIEDSHSQIYFDPLYNDETTGIRFLSPKTRPRQSNPVISSEFSALTIGVGETVLIPVFSKIANQVPFPIYWAINNDSESKFTSILDEARPVGPNRESWMLVGPGITTSTELRGPSYNSPVKNSTGCERRFYASNKLRFESGVLVRRSSKKRVPTAYICIHGISVGKGQLIVGEDFPEGEYGSNPSGNYVLLTRKPYVNSSAKTRIKIEVRADSPSPESQGELAFADVTASGPCYVGAYCKLTVVPLNRGGEKLGCGDDIEVSWGTATGIFDEDRDSTCTIRLRPKSASPKGSIYYQTRYGVRAVVNQIIKREMGNPNNGKAIKVENVRQAQAHFMIHPVKKTSSIEVMWGSLVCPKFVAPGIPFRCDSRYSRGDGNNPSDTRTLTLSGWRVPNYVSQPTVSSVSIFGYCMTVGTSVSNDQVFQLNARNTTYSITLQSRKITVSHKLIPFVKRSKGC